MTTFACPRCGGYAFGRDTETGVVRCQSNTAGHPLSAGGAMCGWHTMDAADRETLVAEIEAANLTNPEIVADYVLDAAEKGGIEAGREELAKAITRDVMSEIFE